MADNTNTNEVRAIAKNVRVAPRKARLVVDQIRNQSVEKALELLQFNNRAAAVPVAKGKMEITETAMFENYDMAQRNMEILDKEGIQLMDGQVPLIGGKVFVPKPAGARLFPGEDPRVVCHGVYDDRTGFPDETAPACAQRRRKAGGGWVKVVFDGRNRILSLTPV